MRCSYASHVLPISSSGTLLLERNPLYSQQRGREVLSFIGGGRKRGESEYQTAIREGAEELGVSEKFFSQRKLYELDRENDTTYISTLYTFQIEDEIARLLSMRRNIWSGNFQDVTNFSGDFVVDKEKILQRVGNSLSILGFAK